MSARTATILLTVDPAGVAAGMEEAGAEIDGSAAVSTPKGGADIRWSRWTTPSEISPEHWRWPS